MKRPLLISLVMLLPVLLLLAVTNIIIDPANLYHPDYERNVVKYLLKGKNVSNVSNYDERLLQKLFINGINFTPDVTAIGSSRVMLLNKSEFPGEKFTNSGVSGATVEDLMAVFRLYEKANRLPKKIILGLDPWFLNPNNGQSRWKTLARTYSEARNNIYGTSNVNMDLDLNYSKLTEFLSLEYFQTSIEYLKTKKKRKIIPTDSSFNDAFTRNVDGSITYGKKMRIKTPEQVTADAEDYIAGPSIYSLNKFDHISQEHLDAIDKFIAYMRGKNIEVVIFLAPYHPVVYDFFRKNEFKYKVQECEKLFRSTAQKYNLKVIGSFDPDALGLDNSYFYDGMHFKESALPILTHEGKDL